MWFFIDSKLYHKNDCIPTFRLEYSRFLFGLFFLQLRYFHALKGTNKKQINKKLICFMVRVTEWKK